MTEINYRRDQMIIDTVQKINNQHHLTNQAPVLKHLEKLIKKQMEA